MEILKGQIVRSVAGHDKGNFFVVTDTDGVFASICDGKHRPVQRQKRKKIKHLSLTTTIVDISSITTNREFKKVLRSFNDKAFT